MLVDSLPAISVVIPCERWTSTLAVTLAALKRQALSEPFEVLVIANFHSWRIQRVVKKLGKPFHYFARNKKGANASRNFGVENAKGPIILFLDDDCVAEDTLLLTRHLQFHRRPQEAVGFGGVYQLAEPANNWARAYHEISQSWLLGSRVNDNGETRHLLGGHASYRRETLLQNPFNEDLIFGGTEAEFQDRLARQNLKLILETQLQVTHLVKIGFLDFAFKAFRQGQGHRIRYQKMPKRTSEFGSLVASREIRLYGWFFSRGLDSYGAQARSVWTMYWSLGVQGCKYAARIRFLPKKIWIWFKSWRWLALQSVKKALHIDSEANVMHGPFDQ